MQLQDRRFHVAEERPARVVCRVCFKFIPLSSDRLRYLDDYWVMSCPECSGSFPVRAEDGPGPA